MPAYKHPQFFKHMTGPAFDNVYRPGTTVPLSGIYICPECGDEIASNKGTPFPPQNHHQHRPGAGLVRWQLIAAAVQV